MLILQHTIDLGAMRGLNLSVRLKSGSQGYVMVRDDAAPETEPLISRILGPHYPLVLELRPKLVKASRQLSVYADAPDCLELEIEPLGRFWRLQRGFKRNKATAQSLWAAWRTGRKRAYAAWHRRYNAPSSKARQELAAQWRALEPKWHLRIWRLGTATEPSAEGRGWFAGSDVQPGSVMQAASLDAIALPPKGGPTLDVIIEAGTKLEPWTLGLLALRAARETGPCLIFGDSEAVLEGRQLQPLLTTDFDRVRALSSPGSQVLGIAATNDLAAFMDMQPAGQTLEAMAVAAARAGSAVIHLPAVLSRLRSPPQARAGTIPPFARNDQLVSLIIPSRDNGAMLEQTVASLHARRGDVKLEFVIVDHASQKAETQETLRRLQAAYGVNIVRAEGDFNFSRLMNLGRAAATGDYLFSVNDDIEARSDNWLHPLLAWLDQPGTGSVGPCLLYPGGTIQHAGVVVGICGFADHFGRGTRWDKPQVPALLRQTRTVSAVTGAVLGAKADVWDRAGGWDENLTVEFNDTEFCLRLGSLGLRNIYCADSVLIHHESVSRGDPKHSRQWPRIRLDRQAFINANSRALSYDRWHPANLSLRTTRLRLAEPPRRLPIEMMAQPQTDRNGDAAS